MTALRSAFMKVANSMKFTRKKGRPFTVIVEGNMGSGKTTFLEHFNKYKYINILSEPIDMWRDCSGHNLLKHMYDDPVKWSFSFESYVLLTMLNHHVKQTFEPIKIIERSIYSARYCFFETMLHDGLLSAPSAAVLDHWFKWLCRNADVSVDLIVYLRTSPEVVYRRIKKRDRAEEKPITFDYVEKLHNCHDDWLYHKTKYMCPAPVLTLNANLDTAGIQDEYEKCKSQIKHKVPYFNI